MYSGDRVLSCWSLEWNHATLHPVTTSLVPHSLDVNLEDNITAELCCKSNTSVLKLQLQMGFTLRFTPLCLRNWNSGIRRGDFPHSGNSHIKPLSSEDEPIFKKRFSNIVALSFLHCKTESNRFRSDPICSSGCRNLLQHNFCCSATHCLLSTNTSTVWSWDGIYRYWFTPIFFFQM